MGQRPAEFSSQPHIHPHLRLHLHLHCHLHIHHHEHPRLKERDIKIAICTSDSREGTIEFLERMGLESMVDIIVCGDDEV